MSEKCSALSPDAWAIVADLDICPHSKRQIQIAKEMSLPLKGAIFCNEDEHKSTEACMKAPAFPMWCNVTNNQCFAGLRETCDQFEQLERLSQEKSAKK